MDVHGNVGIENGYFGNYVQVDKDELAFNPRGRAVLVEGCIRKLETGQEKLKLGYVSNTEEQASLTIDRGELVRSSATKFLSHGMDAYEENMPYLLKTIQQQEGNVEITHEHDGIGWMEYGGKRIYRGHKLIVPKEMDLKSTYSGHFDIVPKGSPKKYLQMLKDEVVGTVQLEFALCMGVSSIVTGYFSHELGFESFIYSIAAESSTGKTSAGQLAVSVSSNPTLSANSLMTTWNNTANYQMAMLRGNHGMMVLFDESSTLGKRDITNNIYDFTGGKERGRMSKDLSLADTGTWCTTFMSTGEGSLKSYVKQNSGIRVRLFESVNETWTRDAMNADAIKQCVTENYGFVGIMIAKYLVNEDYEVAKKAYYENVQFYLDGLETKDEFSDRIAKKMATILYSVDLLNKLLKLKIDKEQMREFLMKQQTSDEEEKDLGLKAYDYILEVVASNINKFYRKMKSQHTGLIEEAIPKGEVWGKLDTRTKDGKTVEEIVFIPHYLHEVLKHGGFTNPATIMKKLKEKGLLDFEEGKYRRKRKLPHTKGEISVYCILVECAEENTSSTRRKRIEEYKRTKQMIAEIFDED